MLPRPQGRGAEGGRYLGCGCSRSLSRGDGRDGPKGPCEFTRAARDRLVPLEAVTARPPGGSELQLLAGTFRRHEVPEP